MSLEFNDETITCKVRNITGDELCQKVNTDGAITSGGGVSVVVGSGLVGCSEQPVKNNIKISSNPSFFIGLISPDNGVLRIVYVR